MTVTASYIMWRPIINLLCRLGRNGFPFFSNPSQTFLEKDMQDVSRTLNYDSNQRINRWLFYANQLHSLQGGTEINYGVKYTATHDNSYQFYRDGETGSLDSPIIPRKLLSKKNISEYVHRRFT